jgi:hypothetical protein
VRGGGRQIQPYKAFPTLTESGTGVDRHPAVFQEHLRRATGQFPPGKATSGPGSTINIVLAKLEIQNLLCPSTEVKLGPFECPQHLEPARRSLNQPQGVTAQLFSLFRLQTVDKFVRSW